MKYEVIDKKRIFDEFFTIEKADVKYERFRDGSWNRSRRYNLQRPEAAAIILENESTGNIVLVEQFRYATVEAAGRDGWILEIVAGLVDRGETPERCAIRESLEEAGYRVRNPRYLCSYFTSVGISDEKVHLYYGQVCDRDRVAEGGGLASENEDLAVREIPLTELMSLLKNGKIADAKTIVALQWLALERIADRQRLKNRPLSP